MANSVATTIAKPATPGAQAMLAARRANMPAAPDPYAPMSPAGMSAIVGKYVSGLPAPMTPDQIQSSAQSELDPIIAAITKNIQGQAATASSQIGANSSALAARLGAIDYGAPYQTAKEEQAATDAALQSALSGAGSSDATDLRSRLAAINDPTVGTAADRVAGQGGALGTTQLARGTSALSNLIAAAAAAREYGTKQPGIVQQSGLQDIAGVNQKATQSIADSSAKLQEQLPGIVNELRSRSDTAATNRTELASKLYEFLTGQNTSRAALGVKANEDTFNQWAKTAGLQQGAARVGIAQRNSDIAAQRAAQTALSQNRTYQVQLARLGISQRADQRATLALEYKLQNGGFTPMEIAKFHGMALKGMDAVTPGETYQQVVKWAQEAGIPLSIALPVINADPKYAPGVNGRPLAPLPAVLMPKAGSSTTPPLGGQGFGLIAGGFLPKGAAYTQGRTDQGRDFQTTPGGPIIAPGSGTVVAVKSDPKGFGPSYPVVHFTSGPYAGQTLYIGHTLSTLKPGSPFKQGQVISRTGTSPVGNAGVPGWAEIGFAPGGVPGAFGQQTPFGS